MIGSNLLRCVPDYMVHRGKLSHLAYFSVCSNIFWSSWAVDTGKVKPATLKGFMYTY